MKNIHLLPTDKSSRLSIKDGILILHRLQWRKGTQHIYITSSNEEIKDEDWCLLNNRLVVKYFKPPIKSDSFKKIILTTDQDLNGVQAIDDEFLEWFVNNPSCEWVEIIRNSNYEMLYKVGASRHKILIPKEESELQCKDCNDNLTDCTCTKDAADTEQCPESTGDIFSDYAVGESKAIQNSMHLDAEIACRSMNRLETTADYIDKHVVEAMVELAKQNLYSEKEVKHLMTLAFEQGFKKADVVEAGLEAKETDTEVNWIFLKHKK